MRKMLAAGFGVALFSSAAVAADIPMKAPPYVPPPLLMWSGFHVGLNAGGSWANSDGPAVAVAPVAADLLWGLFGSQVAYLQTFAAAGSVASVNGGDISFIGGGQIGYDWQVYNNVLFGFEADVQGFAGDGGRRNSMTSFPTPNDPSAVVFIGNHSVSRRLDYFGTARGRLGWLVRPTLLVYGTGGLAYGGVSLDATTVVSSNYGFITGFGGTSFSDMRAGWTAGGGLEWMFWPNWSAKVEYLYYDLGTVRQDFAITSIDTLPATVGFRGSSTATFAGEARSRIDGNILRMGVNYHFSWGAPAPAVTR